MKKILVTGGVGFIGSHVTISLLEKNYDVVIIDSFLNSSKKFYNRMIDLINSINPLLRKNLNIYEGDIRNSHSLEKIFLDAKKEDQSIDGVIHLAGLKAVKESVRHPLNYWDFNLVGAIRLLEAMDKFNCHCLIFSSSATIYGKNINKLINENSNIKPINPYGFTKATIEYMLKNIFDSDPQKWRIANLRYFNPIGAHDSGLIGENPKGIPNNVFPLINKVASREIEKLKIFGNDWNTKDGTCIRDFIHIMDLAEGHILAMEYLLKMKNSKFLNLNLGTGNPTSVLELVKNFQKINNVKVPYDFVNRREGDVDRIVADNKLAKKTLKWEPKRQISDMCIDGWKWHLNNKKFS
tara:strand:- start:5779 stop:6834 length:1056 start_codon:yes stop_codon:yes gene_type:complete